jgi:hypothetical protein
LVKKTESPSAQRRSTKQFKGKRDEAFKQKGFSARAFLLQCEARDL